MTMETPSYDTELRLALPGSNEPGQATSSTTSSSVASRKRFSRDSEDSYSRKFDAQDDESTPPTKAQIVGWPPVQSYRKNSFKIDKQANGSRSGLYVKVNMDGAPYLRKIDLKAYTSYVELLEALEGMFKVKIGEYSEREGRYSQSGNAPSYEDKDGDWMLVGDVPWEMFVSSCKRLRIIKSEANRFHI